MTTEEAKELSEILQAYSQGKIIQRRNSVYSPYFEDVPLPLIYEDLSKYEYRIKPEKKLVPFTFEDGNLFRDKWVRCKRSLPLYRIISYNRYCITIENTILDYEHLMQAYIFEDGSPCGKFV